MIFNHTAHRKLWDWLAKHPDACETDWPGWQDNGGAYMARCYDFACHAAITECRNYTLCDYCPLIWPINLDGMYTCDADGLYDQWFREKDLKKRSKLAEQIRDLPVKEGVKCI